MKKRTKTQSRSLMRIILDWILFICMMVVVLFICTHFVRQKTRVVGSSMYPTIADGEYTLIDTVTYRFSDPKRFDIVVFPFDYGDDTFYLKRVVALPGETIQIVNGEIYINGSKLDDPYADDLIQNPGLASSPITLSEDEYFVMGDNRNDSSDSRTPTVGNIRRKDITGKAVALVRPLDRIRLL